MFLRIPRIYSWGVCQHDKDVVLEVVKDDVDTTQPGTYQVVYRAVDSFGFESTKEIKVAVKEKVVVEENEPEVKPEEDKPEEGGPESNSPQKPMPENPEIDTEKPETGLSSLRLFALGGGSLAIGIQSSKRKIRNKN